MQLLLNLLSLFAAFSHFSEKCVMNNYFGIGLDAKISLEFNNKRDEHPKKCRLAGTPRFPPEKACTPGSPVPAPPGRDHQDAGSHRGDWVLLCRGSCLQQILYLHPLLG